MIYLPDELEKNDLVTTELNFFLQASVKSESVCECERDANEYYAWLCWYMLLLNLLKHYILYVSIHLIQYTVIVLEALVHEEV